MRRGDKVDPKAPKSRKCVRIWSVQFLTVQCLPFQVPPSQLAHDPLSHISVLSSCPSWHDFEVGDISVTTPPKVQGLMKKSLNKSMDLGDIT